MFNWSFSNENLYIDIKIYNNTNSNLQIALFLDDSLIANRNYVNHPGGYFYSIKTKRGTHSITLKTTNNKMLIHEKYFIYIPYKSEKPKHIVKETFFQIYFSFNLEVDVYNDDKVIITKSYFDDGLI